MSADSAEWSWSDGRAVPVEVYIDAAISSHMGDVFVRFTQLEDSIGIFVTRDQWDAINEAAQRAIAYREQLNAEGWT